MKKTSTLSNFFQQQDSENHFQFIALISKALKQGETESARLSTIKALNCFAAAYDVKTTSSNEKLELTLN